MPSRVPPRDRWAIAAYIRALQLSQHAAASDLPAEDQRPARGSRAMSMTRATTQSPTTALRAQLDRLQARAALGRGRRPGPLPRRGLLWPGRFFASYLVGVPLLGRDRAGLHRADDAPPPGRRLVGPADPPADGGGGLDRRSRWRSCSCPWRFNLPILYPWARPEEVRLDAELAHKAAYLNVPSSSAARRSTSSSGSRSRSCSAAGRGPRTRTPTRRPAAGCRQLSGPGLVILFLTGTFAAIDWGMSLEPRWASTIYGRHARSSGEALATLAMMIVVAIMLASDRPMSEPRPPAGSTTWAT